MPQLNILTAERSMADGAVGATVRFLVVVAPKPVPVPTLLLPVAARTAQDPLPNPAIPNVAPMLSAAALLILPVSTLMVHII